MVIRNNKKHEAQDSPGALTRTVDRGNAGPKTQSYNARIPRCAHQDRGNARPLPVLSPGAWKIRFPPVLSPGPRIQENAGRSRRAHQDRGNARTPRCSHQDRGNAGHKTQSLSSATPGLEKIWYDTLAVVTLNNMERRLILCPF